MMVFLFYAQSPKSGVGVGVAIGLSARKLIFVMIT